MDIKVRDLNPLAIKKIDELAKVNEQSRNQFLKEHIETLSILDEIKKERERFEQSLDNVVFALENTYKKLDVIEKEYENLFLLISIISEIDLDEVTNFIEKDLKNNH